MYGYLKFTGTSKFERKINNTYKCYYCGLCSALKKNFGALTHLFLNYDSVLAVICLASSDDIIRKKPKCCVMKTKRSIDAEYSNAFWYNVAVSVVALAYAKAYDDYLDNNRSIFSSVKFRFMRIISAKARKKNNDIFLFLEQSMSDLKRAEDNLCSLAEHSEKSASMIASAFCNFNTSIANPENSYKLSYAISKWLCLIDAIDDYNRDHKHREYNPLFTLTASSTDEFDYDNIPSSLNDFLSQNYNQIACVYSNILSEMFECLSFNNRATNENLVLESMIKAIMPLKFAEIMRRND